MCWLAIDFDNKERVFINKPVFRLTLSHKFESVYPSDVNEIAFLHNFDKISLWAYFISNLPKLDTVVNNLPYSSYLSIDLPYIRNFNSFSFEFFLVDSVTPQDQNRSSFFPISNSTRRKGIEVPSGTILTLTGNNLSLFDEPVEFNGDII